MRVTVRLCAMALALAGTAPARAASPCGTTVMEDPGTGAVFGHLPYDEAPAGELSPVPRGFGSTGCDVVRGPAAESLDALVAAARADPGVGGAIYGISCFRSIARQSAIYCARGRGLSALEARARTSAPPGHSEHATGYAVDFGDRRRMRCELSGCFADTAVGRWLMANAASFGWEMSFPADNPQGVAYEPWHWRWVGATLLAPGGSVARATFATARRLYPAERPLPDLPTFAPAPDPLAADFTPAPVPLLPGR